MGIRDMVPRRRNGQTAVHRDVEQPYFALQHQMNRLFDEFFRGFGLSSTLGMGEHGSFHPHIDMRETDKAIEVTAELPGMSEKDIEVAISNDGESLSLHGEKRTERQEKDDSMQWSERSYGAFHRTLPLTAEVDPDNVQATMKNGVLTLVLKKRQGGSGQRRKIAVKSS